MEEQEEDDHGRAEATPVRREMEEELRVTKLELKYYRDLIANKDTNLAISDTESDNCN